MTGKRKILLTVLSLLLVCNLAFIWGNSLVSRSDSHDLSVGVLGFLPGFIAGLVPQPRTAGAHCAEDGPLYPNLPAWAGCPAGCWPRRGP